MEKESKVNPYSTAYIDIIWGGMGITFEALTIEQQLVFLDEFMAESISMEADALYDEKVHKSCLAYPRIITVALSADEVHSIVVAELQAALDTLAKLLDKKNAALYNENDYHKLGRLITTLNLNFPIGLGFAQLPYEKIEQVFAVSGVKFDEIILSKPHVMWRDHTDRAIQAGKERAAYMYKMINRGK